MKNLENTRDDAQQIAAELTPPEAAETSTEPVKAWQEIEAGRFMPRRIRGSCIGRALG
jgi:hypothetical protein